MLKKTVTYEDFSGEMVSEDLFFHLTQAELVEMQMSEKDGLDEVLKRIIEAEDGKAIIAEFKKIILASYGKKSEDGKRFIKTQQLRDEFESSEAYSALFMELVTNTDSAIEFTNGIVPVKVVEQATAAIERTNLQAVPEPEEKPEPEVVSRAAVQAMTADELADLGQKISRGEVTIAEDPAPAG